MRHPRSTFLFAAYIRSAFRRPFAWALFWLALTFAALFVGRQIDVRTDLADMLPDDAPSVRALDLAAERSGGTDMFTIAVESPDPVANVRFLDAIAEALSDWDEIEYLEIKHEQDFLQRKALLLLPQSDLQRIRDTLQRMIRDKLEESNPLYVGLDSEEERQAEDRFDWRQRELWIDDLTMRELGLDDTDVSELFPFLSAIEEDDDEVDETLEITRDYRLSESREIGILMARLRGAPTDVAYSRAAWERGLAAIATADPSQFHEEMHAEVVGAYRSFLEVSAILDDVQTATLISIVLVLLIILVFFRRIRALIIILLPLMAGIVWTLGAVRITLGQLNTLTAFVFAMVIGIGIDFGIHLYSRIREERAINDDAQEAVVAAGDSILRALITAALTTCVALLTLLFGSFSGFREFGIASAIGVAMCLIATLALVPLLVALTERIAPDKPRPIRSDDRAHSVIAMGPSLKWTAVGVTISIAALALVSPAAEFEYDFDNLSGPGSGRTIAYEEAVGSQRGTAPAIMLADSEEAMREAHAHVRERLREGDPLVRSLFTIESLVPADMAEREELLIEIEDITSRRAVRRIEGDEGEVIKALNELARAEPFTIDDTPIWAQRQLREENGDVGRIGLLYIDFPRTDALRMQEFQDRYGEIDTEHGTVVLSSLSFVIADVVEYVQRDGKRFPLLVGIALFLMLLIDLRSLRQAVVGLLTLALAALLAAATMGLLGVRVGLYNMIVLPMIMGVGVDSVIHLIHRVRAEGGDRIDYVLRTTGVAILASGLTTAAGFFGLLFVSHLGVRSIGALALIGIASVLIAVLGALPGALVWLERGKPGANAPTTEARS